MMDDKVIEPSWYSIDFETPRDLNSEYYHDEVESQWYRIETSYPTYQVVEIVTDYQPEPDEPISIKFEYRGEEHQIEGLIVKRVKPVPYSCNKLFRCYADNQLANDGPVTIEYVKVNGPWW